MNLSSDEFKKALKGLNDAWDSYFAELIEKQPKISKFVNFFKSKDSKFSGPYFTEPLTYDILWTPTHPVVELFLYLYTIDSWLFSEINSGSKEGDQTKVDALGPYA